MLQGLTADFKAAGHQVTILLDSRIAAFSLPLIADHIVKIAFSSEVESNIKKASLTNDAALVVAPENALQSIVKLTENTGMLSLNCQSISIEKTIDKTNLFDRLGKLKLHYPETEILQLSMSGEEVAQTINEKLGFPAVIKPSVGAGCEGLSVIQNIHQVTHALTKITNQNTHNQIITQKLIFGTPASISLFSTGTQAIPISLNLQEVILATPENSSSYAGGAVPFDHPLMEEAFSGAKKLVESYQGLRGYVGVDVILTDEVFFIEINPRLTTSYVGLRKISAFNPAQAIVTSVLHDKLPKNVKTKGYACFLKVPMHRVSAKGWQHIWKLKNVISPPFFFSQEETVYAFIESLGETYDVAKSRLNKPRKELTQIA